VWLIGLLLACASPPSCTEPGQVLAEAGGQRLTCGEASVVPRYIVRLSARELNGGDRGLALTEVAEAFTADPAATRAWLGEVARAGRALDGLGGFEAAEKRGATIWLADRGQGVIGKDRDDLWNLQRRALSIWAQDDAERLALTEVDIEAWLRYVSLCREAQGGAPLRLSIADRTLVYKDLADAFHAGSRADKIAFLALGPYWPQIKAAWAAAPYELQQAWIAAAPLPPPMTATSLGYSEAILQGDVRRHAEVLHEKLGPLAYGWREEPFGPAAVSP
jgi:hypothetical protein